MLLNLAREIFGSVEFGTDFLIELIMLIFVLDIFGVCISFAKGVGK